MGETDFDKVKVSDLQEGSTDISESEIGVLDGVTPGTASASKALILDANKDVRGVGIGRKVTVASADGAISVKNGTVFITKGSAAALTLADPTATTDDGCELHFIAVTAFAHTVSNAAGSGFNSGGAAKDVATFGGARGDSLTLEAYQGAWYARSSTNITLG
jgi:hypothetical protein